MLIALLLCADVALAQHGAIAFRRRAAAAAVDINIAIVAGTADTGGGTQDFTSSGFGTAKAARIKITRATSLNSLTAHSAMSNGFTDGTNHVVSALACEDNVTTTNCQTRSATDEVAMLLDPTTAGTVECEANFDSFITDGLRINWGVACGSAYQMVVILYGGTDLQTKVLTWEFTTGDGGDLATKNITWSTGGNWGASQTPDILYSLGVGQNNFDDTVDADMMLMMSIAANGETPEEVMIGGNVQNGSSSTKDTGRIDDDFIASNACCTTSDRTVEIDAWLSDGFRLLKRLLGGTNKNIRGATLALYVSTAGYSLAERTMPTSTGDDTVTGLSFQPQHVDFLISNATSMDVITSASTHIASGSFDEDEGFTYQLQCTDAASTSDCISFTDGSDTGGSDTDGVPLVYYLNATALHWKASNITTTITSDGWTINFGTVQGTGAKYFSLAIE